ncbi:phosphate propanoyltransferase [Neobacillus cucumis]|uniref:phosphate propanoyltransferase n=1 Tax=Neobacillus cucumis TaxID=1740721 RepID=UPI0018E009FF|nr:phosphate propanoyltransferase [Neobacillus cucumis]MBI0580742.1 phosphate propanoyltransferase [Neobacillus cucumis]
MNEQAIRTIVEEVIQQLFKKDSRPNTIPMAVSARHCHLSQTDLETLFGKGYELTKKAELSQPGQFAANETVVIVGPRGSIEKVRILGPARSLTQVEVSKTDAVKLGVNPPIRESGNIAGSAPITLVGPKGSIYKNEGLIIAQTHIHMHPDDAVHFGVENGEYVRIRTEGERPVSFEKVLIRVSPRYRLEMHIDTDEANAGLITSGQSGILVKDGEKPVNTQATLKEPVQTKEPEAVIFQKNLLTKRDVQACKGDSISVRKGTIVTPLARDAARELKKAIRVMD